MLRGATQAGGHGPRYLEKRHFPIADPALVAVGQLDVDPVVALFENLELDALMESLKQIEEMLEKLKKLDAEQPETLPFSTYRVSWPGGYIENPWWTWFNTTSDNLRINYLW